MTENEIQPSEEPSPSPKEVSPSERVLQAGSAILNIDLFTDAVEDIGRVDWFRLSLTTFYLGVFGLICWCFYFALAFALQSVLSDNGLWSSFTKAVSHTSMSVIALWIFAGLSRWVAQGIETAHQDENIEWGFNNQLKIAAVSSISLSAALITRSIIFSAGFETIGTHPSTLETVSLIIVDISWVSLILIGVGGLGSLLLVD